MRLPFPGQFPLRGLSLRTKAFVFVGGMALVVTVTLLVLIGEVFMKSAVSIRNEEKKALIESVISQLNQVARQQRSNVFSDAIRDEAFAFLRGARKGPLKRAPISRNSSSGQDYLLLFDRQKKSLCVGAFVVGRGTGWSSAGLSPAG